MDARMDRSWFRKLSGHESPALANLIANWGLVDALAPPDNLEHMDMGEYHTNTHTYTYTIRKGREAPARLDRWYVSTPLTEWVAAVEVLTTGAKSDHRAVRLHLRSPTDPVRIRKPARIYPPPQIAADAVKAHMTKRLQEYHATLQDGEPDAIAWAKSWDSFKVSLRTETLAIIKRRRQTARATYKQRLRRLMKHESRLREELADRAPTVASITDALEAMTLTTGTGGTPLQRVRIAITECTR
ncbi:hypothetical protein PF007_g25337 [Phytophthora fragariae]|uniref:Endonuclease/exonuclease/phosphatase domain-containing protein n=1 Tax=Phytophthora fragariae TaxID=53985 RepID=A0A6A3IAN5_9STRA|nr:hypothetical protein PF003_g12987 [Phytophthora fragariae]KAE8977164.1 hypothetical protein PF011_g23761 [Phytophthora fragariae]KAE9069575.1 hypothetical protein PF006_g29547 [Phytophthora fragariae]KAE9074609.1 hypothetical protein PF007_g25337 [Phytophthora fragariae]KAE9268716.1 hypothetical protein PF001_g29539 [Phytophthora fragariae]